MSLSTSFCQKTGKERRSEKDNFLKVTVPDTTLQQSDVTLCVFFVVTLGSTDVTLPTSTTMKCVTRVSTLRAFLTTRTVSQFYLTRRGILPEQKLEYLGFIMLVCLQRKVNQRSYECLVKLRVDNFSYCPTYVPDVTTKPK